MFNELNKNKGKRFTFNSDELEFANLADIITEKKGNFKAVVRGCFVYDAKHGKRPAIITDKVIINVPNHLVKTVEQILANDDMIDAINRGECVIESYQYKDKDGIERNSVRFLDAEHTDVPFEM